MREQIFVKPKDGKQVIDPATGRALAPEGGLVLKTSYWMRRLAGGEISIVETKKEMPTPVAKPKVETKKEKGGE